MVCVHANKLHSTVPKVVQILLTVVWWFKKKKAKRPPARVIKTTLSRYSYIYTSQVAIEFYRGKLPPL